MFRAARAFLLAITAIAFFALPSRAESVRRDLLFSVTTTLRGAALQATRNTVTQPIELALRDLAGMEAVISISRPGESRVLLKLRTTMSGEAAQDAARAALARIKSSLPPLAEGPHLAIPEVGSAPTAYVALSSDTRSAAELTKIARKHLVEQLQMTANVSEVKQHGPRFDMTVVALDPRMLAAYKLTRDDVEHLLQIGTGYLIEAAGPNELAVYEPWSVLPDPAVLGALVLKLDSGAVVRVRDIAVVERRMRAPEDDARANGWPSFVAEVFVTGMNVPDATVHLRESLPTILRNLPAGINVRLVYDCAACAERRR